MAISTAHAAYAHWVLFGALMLAGLNLPIPEDVVLLIGGVVGSTLAWPAIIKLFAFIYAGALLSDWMVYWIGRLLGPKLWKMGWFRRTIKIERLRKMEDYYRRYGITTLLVGRFIPFGVRNCLFTTAGMARMRWPKFMIADAIACLISTGTYFTLALLFGKNYEQLLSYFELFDIVVFASAIALVIGFFWYKRTKRSKSQC